MLLLGLLLTGGLYAVVRARPGRRTQQADEELVAKGRELFLVGCSFCHGQNGEGVRTERRQPARPVAGRRRRRRRRLPGRHRPDADGPARRPGAAQGAGVYTDEEIAALAAYVASLGPGPAIPDESDYSLEGMSDEEREEAIVRGGQIFLTNCTACHNFAGTGGAMPRGRLRARRSAASSPSTSTRRCSPARRRCRSSPTATSPPEEKRDVIAYLESLEETPRVRRLRHGRPRPGQPRACSPGSSASASLVGFAIWIAAHTTRSKKDKVDA